MTLEQAKKMEAWTSKELGSALVARLRAARALRKVGMLAKRKRLVARQ